MSTPKTLRPEAYREAPSLKRPLDEALSAIGAALESSAALSRDIIGPFKVTGGGLPVVVSPRRSGSLAAVHLARIQPDNADEVLTSLGALHWRSASSGSIELRALPGLTAAATYSVWLEVVYAE